MTTLVSLVEDRAPSDDTHAAHTQSAFTPFTNLLGENTEARLNGGGCRDSGPDEEHPCHRLSC